MEVIGRDMRPEQRSEEDLAFLNAMRTKAPDLFATFEAEEEAMAELRGAALHPTPSANFDANLSRKLRVSAVRDSFRYWSPAIIGAGVAAIALWALLQSMVQTSVPVQLQQQEARRVVFPALPNP